MKKSYKKMVAPIIITVLLIVYYVVYFLLISYIVSKFNKILTVIFLIIPTVFGVMMIKVCIERINEIKGGEEDDLSKY